jgi:hypothetical protein
MASARRRTLAIAALVALASTALPFHASAEWDANPVTEVVTLTDYRCGDGDLPELGIQGDVPKADQRSNRASKGYNCGLALVGHATLNFDHRPPTGNANMAWAGNCAYVSGPSGAVAPQSKPNPSQYAGVAVVDVTDPVHPAHVANLRTPGSLSTSETLHAVTTPEGRSILVIGQYGNDQVSDPKPMDIYDVSDPDCTKARPLGTFMWPENIHNLTISANGQYVFATQPLQALDITPLFDLDPATGARYLGNIDDAMEGPMFAVGPSADLDDAVPAEVRQTQHPSYSSHEAWATPDGTKLYLGGQLPTFEVFTIVDISNWLARDAGGRPLGPPRIISQRSGRGHSVRTATIKGTPFVLHSEESPFGAGYSCAPESANPFAGPSQPWLTDIGDEANPKLASQFGLAINNPENCPKQLEAGETDGVHYHDVDDPNDTTFVMASMWNAGIRVFDVRNPASPVEVAYFNPADVDPSATGTTLDHAWGHIRYVPSTGHLWFATADGGFWVVEIEPQVRTQLGLDAAGAAGAAGAAPAAPVIRHPNGRPGTVGVSLPAAALTSRVDVTPYYCTLGTARGANTPVRTFPAAVPTRVRVR